MIFHNITVLYFFLLKTVTNLTNPQNSYKIKDENYTV